MKKLEETLNWCSGDQLKNPNAVMAISSNVLSLKSTTVFSERYAKNSGGRVGAE